jgi:ribonuclease P protein component
MGKFTFRKEERLKKENDIQELFSKGSSFYLYPFKVLTRAQEDNPKSVHKILVSVSKKNFKRAVDRNLLKRRIREAFRLQKAILPPGPYFNIGLVYTSKEILPSDQISSKMVHLLRRISKVS